MEWLKSNFLNRNLSISFDETNGLIFNNVLLPEEIVLMILSYSDMKTVLKCKNVCKKWNELIKSHHFWRLKLAHIKKICKKVHPWYTYYMCYKMFDKNLLKNGNGEHQFKYWKVFENGGDEWVVENPPKGADPLPANIPEFNGQTSCFATSFQVCLKSQFIEFKNNKVLQEILDEYQPKICVSEWFAGRFDCSCVYQLGVRLYDRNKRVIFEKQESRSILQWAGKAWEKVEISCENYGKGVCAIEFFHQGNDTQFWAGHYGSKMAGGIVKIIFDFI